MDRRFLGAWATPTGTGLEAWKSGNLEAWEPGSLEAWKSGRLEVWKPGSLKAWEPGKGKQHLLQWAHFVTL